MNNLELATDLILGCELTLLNKKNNEYNLARVERLGDSDYLYILSIPHWDGHHEVLGVCKVDPDNPIKSVLECLNQLF